MKRTAIVVYVHPNGVDDMIQHILDGSQAKHSPSVTVGATVNGVLIPMMDRNGKVETNARS